MKILSSSETVVIFKNIHNIIMQGKGMMPGFPQIPEKDRQQLVNFLIDKSDIKGVKEISQTNSIKPHLPFQHMGYTKFLDQNSLPAISPPWGTLQALDLNTGEYLWKVPLGETEISYQAIDSSKRATVKYWELYM